MSRPVGATGKRTRKFSRLVNRLEREKLISVELVLCGLFQRATNPDPAYGAMANAAARQLLDRIVGPTVKRVELDVEVGADPLVKLLREIAADRAAQLTEGSITSEVAAEPEPL